MLKEAAKFFIKGTIAFLVFDYIMDAIGKGFSGLFGYFRDSSMGREERERKAIDLAVKYYRIWGKQCPECLQWVPDNSVCAYCGALDNESNPVLQHLLEKSKGSEWM
ncbi:MAG: hypothetical protein MUD12_15480 [Spirochaetes bacterium]|jgi:hypothetical protein|nr:hypothetical protein [Spirochaetota bacterium]